MKTIRETVTEKLSRDPNIRVATSQERQVKPDRKSLGTLTLEVTSVTGKLQWIPTTDSQGHDTKQEKYRSRLRTKTTLRKDRFESMETKKATICQAGKRNRMKNEKPGSVFKMPLKKKSPIRTNKHCNTQGLTESLRRTYSIENMDSNTDCIVAGLILEEVLNNYKTRRRKTLNSNLLNSA